MGGFFSSPQSEVKNFFDLHELDINLNQVDFSTLKGKVVLNYKEFSELAAKYDSSEFTIVAFPCNQFGFQEPGTNEEIKKFAESKGFKGLLMNKVNVNGKNASPVFQFLKVASGDTSLITWNFAKFLVKRDGTVHGRYGPRTNPLSIVPDIEECLKQKP